MALALGLLAFFLAWQYLSFTIALFGSLGILVAAAMAERHGLISSFLLALRTPISFGRTGDEATGHSKPRFAVLLSNVSFVELAIAVIFTYLAFDDYSAIWSPVIVGIVAFWVAWRINLLRSLGVIFLLRNFFKGIGLVLSLLLIGTIWLLSKLRIIQLLVFALRCVWWPVRITRIYWVVWLPFWLMFRGVIRRNKERTERCYEELFALSRVTDPTAVEYLRRVGEMHWGLRRKYRGYAAGRQGC
jgi:hypothetical protein